MQKGMPTDGHQHAQAGGAHMLEDCLRAGFLDIRLKLLTQLFPSHLLHVQYAVEFAFFRSWPCAYMRCMPVTWQSMT